jgi:hypothetical protein
MNTLEKTVIKVAIAYCGAFLVAVALGRDRAWPDEFGFRYSKIERVDRVLGSLFRPLYDRAHLLGLQRLTHPLKTL